MNDNRAMDLVVVAVGVLVVFAVLWMLEQFTGLNFVGGP